MKNKFDVIVVGAGPAGYVAAIKCAQLGMDVACIDKWMDADNKLILGGTCLNVGCIPSKALLESSEKYDQAIHQFNDHGVNVNGVELDLDIMQSRKARIVNELTNGVSALFKANGVNVIGGHARLLDNSHIEVTDIEDVVNVYQANNIILATGSSPVEIEAAPQYENLIVNSTGALSFSEVPDRLGIIGAGVIGLELGSVWRRLGSNVVLLEAQDCFLSIADEQVAKEALRQYLRQGLDIRLGTRVVSSSMADGKVTVDYTDRHGTCSEKFDKLIVAVGRLPNTKDLFSDESRLLIDEWGFIHVDEQCRTNLPNVYAIGDVVRGPMLAHKGSEEGVMVAELIAGKYGQVNYNNIPSVIYTSPEVAWTGKNEQTLKTEGIDYRVGAFPFGANGRARAHGDTVGFVKILADTHTDKILGVHMIGPNCSELIAQAVIAIEFGASSEDLALTVFAHPTLSEVVHEAALDVSDIAIHTAKKRR